jgi:hypothetical protein
VKVITNTQLDTLNDIVEAVYRLAKSLSANVVPEVHVNVMKIALPHLAEELRVFHRSLVASEGWQTLKPACKNQHPPT